MIRLVIIIVLLPFKLSAQRFSTASFLGTGNSGLGKQSIYCVGSNPAGITALPTLTIASIYEQHFLSTEIESQTAFFSVPLTKTAFFAGGLSRYGIAKVSNVVGLKAVYAKQFGGRISAAVALNYHRFYVIHYEDDYTYSADLGFQYKFSGALCVGVLIRNVTMSAFNDDVEQWIPAEVGIGANYIVSPELSLALDTYYDIYTELNVKTGIQYEIDRLVKFQVGLNLIPLQYFAGIDLSVSAFHINIASSFHSRLGVSPQLAISYAF